MIVFGGGLVQDRFNLIFDLVPCAVGVEGGIALCSPAIDGDLGEVKARSNQADLATTLIHEYAHARLHFDVDEPDERSKREVEAEAVAYVVGRYFGLDTSNSAFYLAAWQGEQTDVIQDRLQRISKTSTEFIEMIDCAMEENPA